LEKLRKTTRKRIVAVNSAEISLQCYYYTDLLGAAETGVRECELVKNVWQSIRGENHL